MAKKNIFDIIRDVVDDVTGNNDEAPKTDKPKPAAVCLATYWTM
jgi:hypothetical protein